MDKDLFEDDFDRTQRLRAQYGIGPEDMPGSLQTPASPTPSPGTCVHARTTNHGSNGKQRTIKCKDCHMVLQVEKVE